MPGTALIETLKNVVYATDCEHPDRSHYANGKCRPCYRAGRKAEQLAKELERTKSGEASEEKAAAKLKLTWDQDPELKEKFGRIMWGWLEGAEVEEIWVEKDGERRRDFQTEARLAEINQRKADKAATVLAKGYVTEKVEEVKPQPLPIGASVDMSGWGLVGGEENFNEDGDGDDEE